MKLIILTLLLTSCGVAESLKPKCGSDIKMGCNAIFGYSEDDQDAAIANLEKKNAEQDARLNSLESQIKSNIQSITALSSTVTNYNSNTALVLNSLQNSVNANLVQMLSITNTLHTITDELAQIDSSNTFVSEIIDPCGDGPGFDEVLLRTNDGKLVAYFQHGNERFLTLLSAGNYITTDGTDCRFTVTSSGEVK